MILLVLSDLCYNLKWPIYSCFLIGQYMFSTISPVRSGIFKFFKHMFLRYFFVTVVTDSCYDLKSPPYAPIFYVKTIKMCIHPQVVRTSTFSNITYKNTFSRYSSGAYQIYAMI